MNINFVGFDVIVRDESTKETLLMGKVIAYDKGKNLIELNIQGIENIERLERSRMQVLLFREGQAFNFHGTFRKVGGVNQIGIALYKGGEKTDRKSERFLVNLNAQIAELKSEQGSTVFQGSMDIHILDISRSGIRIQGYELKLNIKERMTVRFLIHNQLKICYARVVRIGKKDPVTKQMEYGCELIARGDYDLKNKTYI